jgi:hypothetical protein
MKLRAKKSLSSQDCKHCYALKVGGKEIKKDKGVKKSVASKELTLEDYKAVLFSSIPQYRKMNLIRNVKHDIYIITVNKLALCMSDDK